MEEVLHSSRVTLGAAGTFLWKHWPCYLVCVVLISGMVIGM